MKKLVVSESELTKLIQKAVENKLNEQFESEFSVEPNVSKTPRETELEDVFGKYSGEVPADVIRYMRKNPDHILRRMAKLYPDIYMRHIPLQSNTELEMDDVMIGEEEQMNVYDKNDNPDWKNIERGQQFGVKGDDGTVRTFTANESTQKLFKKFLNRK